jgi:cytochrome c peroxidase
VLAVALLASAAPARYGLRAGKETSDPETRLRTPNLPEVPYRYANVELPAHFRTPLVRRFDNTPADNPITDAGAMLGRVLFYDTRLSVNNSISCGSCHQQQHAFADPRRFSKGFNGQAGDRHAMSLVNLRFSPRGRFFRDERAASLEQQVLMPLTNKAEMGHDLPRLVEILGKDDLYRGLFQKAFGDPGVTRERLARALAQFVRSLVSSQSRYDEGLAKVGSVRNDFPNFTTQENHGKQVFLRRCAVCHLPPGQQAVFLLPEARNNGLDADARAADLGVGDRTLNPFEAGRFRSVEMRNIEVAGPFMHDGRFATLDEAVEFYSTGVKLHPNLDGRLRGPAGRRRIDAEEKVDLVAFLKTLTDSRFLNDIRFSDPFVKK